MFKRMVIYAGSVIVVTCAGFLYFQYDELFVFPKLRSVITNQLKDPASTQYRNERLISSNWMCGELNSKNGNGGYVGFKRFIASAYGEAYLEEIGYFGTESDDTKRVIAKLDEKIIVLKELDSMPVQSTKWSDFEVEREVTKRLFERKWQEICGV